MPTLEQFKNARSVLKGVIRETSLIDYPALSKGCGNRVYLKPENMQVTGAYKIRGAYYKISTLSQEEKERGLITASAGKRGHFSYRLEKGENSLTAAHRVLSLYTKLSQKGIDKSE